MSQDDLASFKRERDAMLLSLDVRQAKAFHRKYSPEAFCPADDVILIGLHKARTGALSLPQEARDLSRKWLEERGFDALN